MKQDLERWVGIFKLMDFSWYQSSKGMTSKVFFERDLEK